MTALTVNCERCGEPMPKGLGECPACGARVVRAPAVVAPPSAPPVEEGQEAGEVMNRLRWLDQLSVTAEPLGVEIPAVPKWVAAQIQNHPEGAWLDLLAEVESTARSKTLEALKAWESRTLDRLKHLGSYSIDGRLEREQIDDAMSAGRAGEFARALGVVHQVDRVLALKERHLEAARQDLERLIDLLRELRELGMPVPYDPTELSEDLEEELHEGRLARLKQQLRALRIELVRSLRTSFPTAVSSYGEALVRQRGEGRDVGAAIAELARTARAYSEGRPDEAIRRLRRLSEEQGPARPGAAGGAGPGAGGPTGPSRRA